MDGTLLTFPEQFAVVHVGYVFESTLDQCFRAREEDLMRMWLTSRSYPWQLFSSKGIQGKVILRDLTIDRKTGVYTVDIRKYSGNEF